MKVSMELSKSVIVRAFGNPAFNKVMMVRWKDAPVASVKQQKHAVLLFDSANALIGVNLFDAPIYGHGYIPINESLKHYLNERFSELSLEIQIDDTPYFVCGKIKKIERHPSADGLHVCSVDIGHKEISIVCKAKNVTEDMLTVVALPNAVLGDGKLIEEGLIAGIPSQGMMCSLLEITGGKKPVKGLIELPKDTVCGSVPDIAALGETLC